jgi:hypothetical protein
LPSPLADAHIAAERRLRLATAAGVGRVWQALPGYDRANVDEFLSRVLPLVDAAKRQSIALTDAYLARSMDRPAIGVDVEAIIAAMRGGVPPEEVYQRPFVRTWTDLKAGTLWVDAVAAGLAQATSTAEMDVQIAMRDTVHRVGLLDDSIHGWERVPDGGACEFCLIAATQTYNTSDLQPLHNRCGCSVAPITDPGIYGASDRIEGDGTTVAVEQHSELGPVLTNAADNFAHI